jgi:hypothetical protein
MRFFETANSIYATKTVSDIIKFNAAGALWVDNSVFITSGNQEKFNKFLRVLFAYIAR